MAFCIRDVYITYTTKIYIIVFFVFFNAKNVYKMYT